MVNGKIAVLGGAGMLGTDVSQELKNRSFVFDVFDLPSFDITNQSHLEKVVNEAALIINCAAYTDVEKAESEADLAYRINADAVGRLGALAKKGRVYVLHVSTDFVFDGASDKPYVETDLPNPINVYGASKLAGEKLLIESGCNHCIMRVEWTYGRAGKNFITKLIDLAKKTRKIKVVDDQTGSPTATTEVAKAICELIDKKPQEVLHFANSGYASRFEVAKFVFEKLKMQVDLTTCKSSDLKTNAKRPLNSRFDCSKIEALLGRPIDHWKIPLERFLKQL